MITVTLHDAGRRASPGTGGQVWKATARTVNASPALIRIGRVERASTTGSRRARSWAGDRGPILIGAKLGEPFDSADSRQASWCDPNRSPCPGGGIRFRAAELWPGRHGPEHGSRQLPVAATGRCGRSGVNDDLRHSPREPDGPSGMIWHSSGSVTEYGLLA